MKKETLNRKPIGEYWVATKEIELIVPFGEWYIDDTDTIRQSVTSDTDYWAARLDYKKLVAISSNHPQAKEFNLYTFEVRSKAEELALEGSRNKYPAQNQSGFDIGKNNKSRKDYSNGFIEGYKAAKGLYTEEEMMAAFEYFQYRPFPHNIQVLSFEEFISSLHQTKIDIWWEEIQHPSVISGGLRPNDEFSSKGLIHHEAGVEIRPLTKDNALITPSGELVALII